MKISRLKFSLAIAGLMLLAVFSLPDLRLQIGDQTYKWQGIDGDLVGFGIVAADLQRGLGLYPSLELRMIDRAEGEKGITLGGDAALVRRRLDAAGISDIEISQSTSPSQATIIFTAPNHYSEVELQDLTSLLIAPGEIEFWQHDASLGVESGHPILNSIFGDYRPSVNNLQTSDISALGIENRVQAGGTVLRVYFTETGQSKFNSLSGVAQLPLVMAIDGQPQFYLVDLDVSGTSPHVVAVPVLEFGNAKGIRIMSTYLLGSQGVQGDYALNTLEPQPATLAPQGRTFVVVMLAAACIAALAVIWQRLGWKAALAFAVSLAYLLLLWLGLLKLGLIAISVSLMELSLFVLFSGILMSYRLVAATSELEVKLLNQRYRLIAGVLFILAAALLSMRVAFGIYIDMLNATVLFASALWLVSWVWTYTIAIYLEEK